MTRWRPDCRPKFESRTRSAAYQSSLLEKLSSLAKSLALIARKMSEPKVEMPGLVVQAAAELCPSGLLRKLARVSKAFRDACKKESDCRARISGTSLPPISVCLLTTAHEVDWAVQSGCPADERLARALAAGGSLPALERAVGLGAPLTLGVRRAAQVLGGGRGAGDGRGVGGGGCGGVGFDERPRHVRAPSTGTSACAPPAGRRGPARGRRPRRPRRRP